MAKMWAHTARRNPGLHVWRAGTSLAVNLRPVQGSPAAASHHPVATGWVLFEYDFEPLMAQPVGMMVFDFDEQGRPGNWERHERFFDRNSGGDFPNEVWFTEGTSRVLLKDPRTAAQARLKVHLISQARYRPSELFLWIPGTGWNRRVRMEPNPVYDTLGPVFDFELEPQERSFFNLKFIRKEGDAFSGFEPDFANRSWSAQDGPEIWTHSEAAEITSSVPARKRLTVHFRQEFTAPPELHLWQLNSDYISGVTAAAEQNGWWKFEMQLYTNMRYGFLARNRALGANEWEHHEARRELQIPADTSIWALEGSRVTFSQEPRADAEAHLTVAVRPPYSQLAGDLAADVRVDRARESIFSVPVQANGSIAIKGYRNVRTIVRFRDAHGRTEQIEGHPIVLGDTRLNRFVVLERPPLLERLPPPGLFEDPPFPIRRPGACEEGGFLHFALHAPDASRVDLIAEWTQWREHAVAMKSTRDGTYWWARIKKSDLLQQLRRAHYHGAKYRFLFNETTELQDPAAGWVESSWSGASSQLIDPSRFTWQDAGWQRPGFDYYTVYQLHPARFSSRHPEVEPLRQVAREVESNAAYLRDPGVTAILLMPLNEVGSNNGWGYDPAFFYAIERSYGGPDALKELVNTCHRNGLAVLLDVVFNHAGNIDNILWSVARGSFFDGDTAWGSMINFDHPQCRHFFAQNLVYLAREFHIDGFRLDHTYTIVHSHEQNWYVRAAGSGGGWEFLHALRHAVHSQVDSRVLLMAEHLPNEWALTNFGGPMDTQWCDAFHDCLIEACKGAYVMSALAEAMQVTHRESDDWHKATNYPESHDEVGNVRDRVTFVAGWGRGLRMSKVAAAAAILARGIPMFFMGAEAGEDAQFTNGSTDRLNLGAYLNEPARRKVRDWWKEMLSLRRSPIITGPAPLAVTFAEEQMLAFTRGNGGEVFVLLNFGGWSGWKPLTELNLPGGVYCELWNSTWPAFAIESEDEGEHMNWGRDARLTAGNWLHIPDYGVVVLSRVG